MMQVLKIIIMLGSVGLVVTSDMDKSCDHTLTEYSCKCVSDYLSQNTDLRIRDEYNALDNKAVLRVVKHCRQLYTASECDMVYKMHGSRRMMEYATPIENAITLGGITTGVAIGLAGSAEADAFGVAVTTAILVAVLPADINPLVDVGAIAIGVYAGITYKKVMTATFEKDSDVITALITDQKEQEQFDAARNVGETAINIIKFAKYAKNLLQSLTKVLKVYGKNLPKLITGKQKFGIVTAQALNTFVNDIYKFFNKADSILKEFCSGCTADCIDSSNFKALCITSPPPPSPKRKRPPPRHRPPPPHKRPPPRRKPPPPHRRPPPKIKPPPSLPERGPPSPLEQDCYGHQPASPNDPCGPCNNLTFYQNPQYACAPCTGCTCDVSCDTGGLGIFTGCVDNTYSTYQEGQPCCIDDYYDSDYDNQVNCLQGS